MKRVLSLTIALCLLLAMLPAPAFATTTEETEPASRGSGEISAWVNPIYEDILTPADLALSQEPESPEQEPEQDDQTVKNEQELLTSSAYLSPDEAAVLLRQYMRERRENITLKVYYGAYNKDALLEEVLNKAVAHTGNPTEGDYLLWHFVGWSGLYDYTYDSQNSWYCFDFELQLSYLTTAAQERAMNQAVANLLATLNVDQKSEYEKIKAVYDYICSNVTYDYANLGDTSYLLKHSAYAALINKTAVCQGYATLLYRLLLELGVDSRVIAGELFTGDAHGWNIARIGQVYYNLDATLDAEADPDVCFLRNSVLDYTHYRYLEYETTEFHRTYPMSATDYQEGVEGVPEYIFVAGMCGDDAYWGIDRDGKLTITGTGATYDHETGYTSEGPVDPTPWYYWQDGFHTVIVEEGITALGGNSFNSEGGLKNVVSVTLPNSLTSIRSAAFYHCDNLETVTFGNTLESIGERAFGSCYSLKELILPESLTSIGDSAFLYCKNLVSITIPDGVTEINGMAFMGCAQLQTVTLGNGIETINRYTFSGCTSLTEINFSDGLKEIGSAAFDGCSALKEITIPSSVVDIGNYAFRKCSALSNIWFVGDAPTMSETTFYELVATVYYPINNDTWTEEARQNYGGTLTWVPYCPEHDYQAVTTEANCIQDGGTINTCTICQDFYVSSFVPATGQHTYTDDADTDCDVCSSVRDLDMPTTPMYRLYNPNSGEHFYTGSLEERENLIAAGWDYEGIAWNAPTNSGDPVHRLYNPNSGDHHYTMSAEERDMLVSVGWDYEGVCWNSATPENLPLHRLYNPNAVCGSHHYTGSEEERDMLVNAGWIYEGIGWFGMLR